MAATHSSRRINVLIEQLGYRKYLEVGVWNGSTFFTVLAEQKTAVDPKFAFDFSAHQNDATRFFQVTSDEYFSQVSGNEQFDVLFLDGLHTFEQTFRDFCSSLSCSHAGSVWVIDDTVPSDVYSALSENSDAIRFRGESGNPGLAWHGDVFKTAFAIHDFSPNLSYCTINTGGNPQTLVWRQPRKNFKPRFNSLETISRLSYFDFRKNAGVMNFCDEASGLKAVIESKKNLHRNDALSVLPAA